MVRFRAYLVCFLLALPTNAAVSLANERKQATRSHAATRVTIFPNIMHRKMANMTVEKALGVLSDHKHTPVGLVALVQSALGASKDRHSEHHDRISKKSLRGKAKASIGSRVMATDDPGDEEAEYGSGGASAAEDMLSEMISDSMMSFDDIVEQCTTFHDEKTKELESTRQNIAQGNARSAQADATRLSCLAELGSLSVKIPKLKEELKGHREQCEGDMEAAKAQLDIISQDLEVMAKILNMSVCAEEEDSSVNLLQDSSVKCCQTEGAHGGVSLLMTTQSGPLASLKSPVARLKVKTMFPTVRAIFRPEHALSLAQVDSDMASDSDMGTAMEYMVIGGHDLNLPVGPTTPVQHAVVCPDRQRKKCTIAGSTSCPIIRNNFLNVQAQIMQKDRDMKRELADTETKCANIDGVLTTQIQGFENHEGKQQAALSKAQGIIQTTSESLRELQNEEEELTREYNDEFGGCEILYGELKYEVTAESGFCAQKLDALANELCGLKKIRMELRRIAGDNTTFMSDIVDCEVDGWVPKEACTKSCGGGTRDMVRNIVTPPSPGATCPPREKTEDCNTKPCPIDCKLSPWSEWTSCTASCNGGMRERERQVKVEPFYDGIPCEETLETEQCNLGPCDVGCELEEWSEWCGCDKLCNGGSQKRYRDVKVEAMGAGRCPEKDDERRLQYQDCNTVSCESLLEMTPQHPYLECKEKVDIILLLDGSGSLGPDGWEATVSFALTFADALELGAEHAEIAALLFSGPDSANFDYCMGDAVAPPDFDVKQACGMHWISHYTDDMQTFKDAIKALEWPRGQTFTHTALELATIELSHGREAPTVVLVVTDGVPTDLEATKEAARKVKKSARLMFALVGPAAIGMAHDVDEMVSLKKEHNILEVMNFTDLTSPYTINSLVSDFCTELAPQSCPYEVGPEGVSCPWGPTESSTCGTSNDFFFTNVQGQQKRITSNVDTVDDAIKICGALCDESPDCGGFNYKPSSKKCYYKKSVSTDDEACSGAEENSDEGGTCIRKVDRTCAASPVLLD